MLHKRKAAFRAWAEGVIERRDTQKRSATSAYSSPHFCEVVAATPVLRVRGVARYRKDAVESDPGIGEGRAAVLGLPARARVPDLAAPRGAVKAPGRATETAERLE